MKVQCTVERWKDARKSAPARWVKVGEKTFDRADASAMVVWAQSLGVPAEPTAGWAVRTAWLP